MDEACKLKRVQYKEMMNEEETDEDMADEMCQEVDSRDEVMRVENSGQ